MNRRAFLSTLIAAGVGTAIDPDRLLWTPRTMITVPAMPIVAQIRIKKMMARIRITGEAIEASKAAGKGAFLRALIAEEQRAIRDVTIDLDRMLRGDVVEVLPAVPGARYVVHRARMFFEEVESHAPRTWDPLSAQG